MAGSSEIVEATYDFSVVDSNSLLFLFRHAPEVARELKVPTDFSFQDATADFLNLDKLIKYINAKQDKVNIFYSTPSCYLYSVYQTNHTFQVKTDDFFPYGSDPHSYWTGYFISRPSLKYYERFGNNFLQIIKQLNALTNLNGERSISYLK